MFLGRCVVYLCINAEFMFCVNHSNEDCFLCQFKREEFPVWCKGEEGGQSFSLVPEALDS